MLNLVPYEEWVNYTIEIFKREGIKPNWILDLACGTGIPTELLLKKKYKVVGLDRSPEMLAVLKKKILPPDTSWQIFEGDMKNFSLPYKVDAAISFYDSINYLLEETAIKSCFKSVFSVLRPKGIFAFDLNTIFSLKEIWDNHSFWRESKRLLTHWRNRYDTQKRISTLFLTAWVKDIRPLSPLRPPDFEEIHQERGYELEEIEDWLRQAGFFKIKFYRHLTFEPPGPETTRVMVIGRVPS